MHTKHPHIWTCIFIHTLTHIHTIYAHTFVCNCVYTFTQRRLNTKNKHWQTLYASLNHIDKHKHAHTQNTYTSLCGNTDSHSSVSSLPEPLDLLLLIIYRQTLLGSEPSAHAQWRWSSRFSRWIGLVATFQNRYSKTDRVFVFLYNTVKVLLLPPASMTTPNGRGYGARKVQEGEVISKDSE